jgi:hypothetical protein
MEGNTSDKAEDDPPPVLAQKDDPPAVPVQKEAPQGATATQVLEANMDVFLEGKMTPSPKTPSVSAKQTGYAAAAARKPISASAPVIPGRVKTTPNRPPTGSGKKPLSFAPGGRGTPVPHTCSQPQAPTGTPLPSALNRRRKLEEELNEQTKKKPTDQVPKNDKK